MHSANSSFMLSVPPRVILPSSKTPVKGKVQTVVPPMADDEVTEYIDTSLSSQRSNIPRHSSIGRVIDYNSYSGSHEVRHIASTSDAKRQILGPFKIIIIGDPRVGKSSFVKRYVQGTFSSHYKTTIGGI